MLDPKVQLRTLIPWKRRLDNGEDLRILPPLFYVPLHDYECCFHYTLFLPRGKVLDHRDQVICLYMKAPDLQSRGAKAGLAL